MNGRAARISPHRRRSGGEGEGQEQAHQELLGQEGFDLTVAAGVPPRLGSLDAYRGFVMFLMMAEVLRLSRVARALRAGTVHVNQYDEDDITVPFGGFKQSGNGRDKSLHALEKYTEIKTTWLRIDAA